MLLLLTDDDERSQDHELLEALAAAMASELADEVEQLVADPGLAKRIRDAADAERWDSLSAAVIEASDELAMVTHII